MSARTGQHSTAHSNTSLPPWAGWQPQGLSGPSRRPGILNAFVCPQVNLSRSTKAQVTNDVQWGLPRDHGCILYEGFILSETPENRGCGWVGVLWN